MTNDELRNNIRDNLINLRKNKNITQVKLAEMMNKSSNAVASWEQGLSLPDVATLYKLSKYYGVTMEYFYLNHEEEGEI